MKDFVKFLPHPAIIAVLAFLIQLITQQTSYLETWICFQTWALYFLAGCTIKNGLKATTCAAIGVLLSMVIIKFGIAFGGGEVLWAFPTAVGIVAFAAILLEKVPAVNLIPAIFIGSGAFFGWMATNGENATYAQAFGVVMGSCLFGMLFGVVTVWARTKYSEMFEVQNTEEEKAQAKAA